MAQPKEKASKGATNDRKRPHTDEYTFEEEGSVVWSADSGESVQVFDGEPLAKRPKVMGRPPLPDVECEHGMMSKRCQKCVYRNRQLKVVSANEYRVVAARVLFLWAQNLVYFGTLAFSIVMPHRDPPGYERVCQVIDSRLESFHLYADHELEALKDRKDEHDAFVSDALATIKSACPVSPETSYMARWLVNNYAGLRDLKSLLGELCASLTDHISDMWNDEMLCPGINDPLYVEHFTSWKGVAWINREGLQATRAQADALVRAYHCTGFSDKPGNLCSKCMAVRRHLQKECSAYKKDNPGSKLLANTLPPGLRTVLDQCLAALPNEKENEEEF